VALGKSSTPLIPGMLMSDRIRINDSPAASLTVECAGRGLSKIHPEAVVAQVAPELLAK
jgi:hypothetical protein